MSIVPIRSRERIGSAALHHSRIEPFDGATETVNGHEVCFA